MAESNKHTHKHPHHHGHKHSHGHHHSHQIKNIRLALFLNIGFTIIEIIGGIFSNSVAVISDAIHDLGDSLALAFSYLTEKISDKDVTDESYTYGLKRLPLISAMINALILFGGSIWVLIHAIERLKEPEIVESQYMIPLAVLGVAVNGFAMMRLAKNEGINSKVISLHLLEDALGWVLVLIGAIVIHFTKFYIIDPILSILISAYILFHAFKNLRDAYFIIIQKSPKDIPVGEIRNRISQLPYVKAINDFHIWSLEGTKHVLSCHALIDTTHQAPELAQLKMEIREIINNYGDFHSTIEFDFPEETDHDHCKYK